MCLQPRSEVQDTEGSRGTVTAPLGWPLPSVSSNSARAKMSSSSSSSFSSLRVALPASVTHLWAGVTPGSPISLPHTRARSLYLLCPQITFSPLASCPSSVPAPAPFPVTPSFSQLAPSVLFLKPQSDLVMSLLVVMFPTVLQIKSPFFLWPVRPVCGLTPAHPANLILCVP